MLEPLEDNGGTGGRTHTLTPGSPALNAGNAGSAAPSYDQRGTGYSRISGAAIDIGAYELQGGGDVIFQDRFEDC